MKDIAECIGYLDKVKTGQEKLDLDYLRKELRELYKQDKGEFGESYNRHILALEIALSDKQLTALNENQLTTFYAAALLIQKTAPDVPHDIDDFSKIQDMIKNLGDVGLQTFIPRPPRETP